MTYLTQEERKAPYIDCYDHYQFATVADLSEPIVITRRIGACLPVPSVLAKETAMFWHRWQMDVLPRLNGWSGFGSVKIQIQQKALKIAPNNRGFAYGEFIDNRLSCCSIQESSSVAPALWLGVSPDRMHLSQEQVALLLPLLQHFAATGELPESNNKSA